MTKKDYDIIAACIGATQAEFWSGSVPKRVIDSLTYRLMLELRLENPRFNESIFHERVGYWRKSHSES